MPKEFAQPLEAIVFNKLNNEPGRYSLAVKDLTSGRRWELNAEPMRSASLIKIYIMIEAFRQAGQGRLDLSVGQLVTDEVKTGGAGSLQQAPAGTVRTWRELISLMIVESDNTATNMLIDRLSMAAINGMICTLGGKDTVLRRKMMDFVAARSGRENITSVTDMVSVLEKLYRFRCLGTDRDEEMLAILKRQEDKCKLPVLLPPDIVIAHKTGELEGAEHDAGIVYGPRCHYAVAVMADSLPDAPRGRAVIADLSRTVYDFLHTMD